MAFSDVWCVCDVTKKRKLPGWVFYSPNLYWGQAGTTSGVQTAEHVYTECTVLFSLALTRYPTYVARLLFFYICWIMSDVNFQTVRNKHQTLKADFISRQNSMIYKKCTCCAKGWFHNNAPYWPYSRCILVQFICQKLYWVPFPLTFNLTNIMTLY